MPTQSPGPRRRRIAGERRGAPTTQAPPTDREDARTGQSVSVRTRRPVRLEKDASGPGGGPRRTSRAGRPRTRWLARRSGGAWGSRASLVALSAVLALLLAVTVAMALGLFSNRGLLGIADLRQADRVTTATDTAPSVAEQAAAAILAYDYRTLDADRQAALRFMTPDMAAKYKKTFDRVVRSAAVDSRAKVTAAVKASGVIRAEPDRVRVLLFVDQTTVSSSNPNPQQALNRVEMIMVRSGSDWLVDDITSY